MKTIARVLSFLFCVGIACGIDSQCHETDDIALLQHSKARIASRSSVTVKNADMADGSSMEDLSKEGADACACLEWKKVYSDHGVTCGTANELMPAPDNGVNHVTKKGFNQVPLDMQKMHVTLNHVLPMPLSWFGEACLRFFPNIGRSFCVNVEQGNSSDWKNDQWCYVSSMCKSLGNGAEIPGADVSWKTCDHRDERLRDMFPPQLSLISKQQELDAGLLVKMAYPVISGGMSMSNSTQIKLQSGDSYPVVFDSLDHHPPYQAVYDGKIYAVVKNNWTSGNPPSVWNNITCVKGC